MAKSLDELKNQVAHRHRDVDSAGAAVIEGARKLRDGLGAEVAAFLRDEAKSTVLAMGSDAPTPENVRALRVAVDELAERAQENITTVLSGISDTDWLNSTVNTVRPLSEATGAITQEFRALMERFGVKRQPGPNGWRWDVLGTAASSEMPASAGKDYHAAVRRLQEARSALKEAENELATAVTAAAWDGDE